MSEPAAPRSGPAPLRDARDIDAMVASYAALIVRAVRRVAGPRAGTIADDVQQNVAVALWRQLQRGQTIERPASYIFRAAVRETVRLLRGESGPVEATAPDPETIAADPAAGDPHRGLEQKERQQAVRDAIAALQPKRQQAVRAHLAGFGVQEIMEMFGWPYQTARHLIARGMSDLRQALRERGIHE